MAKSAKLETFESNDRIYKQGEDASSMMFILQGRCLATYSWTALDKRAKLLGKENRDGLMKGVMLVNTVKAGLRATVPDNSSDHSQRSGRSFARSLCSRGSRRNSMRNLNPTLNREASIRSNASGIRRRNSFNLRAGLMANAVSP